MKKQINFSFLIKALPTMCAVCLLWDSGAEAGLFGKKTPPASSPAAAVSTPSQAEDAPVTLNCKVGGEGRETVEDGRSFLLTCGNSEVVNGSLSFQKMDTPDEHGRTRYWVHADITEEDKDFSQLWKCDVSTSGPANGEFASPKTVTLKYHDPAGTITYGDNTGRFTGGCEYFQKKLRKASPAAAGAAAGSPAPKKALFSSPSKKSPKKDK